METPIAAPPTQSSKGPRRRWKYLDNILNRTGPFTDETFAPGMGTIQALERNKILFDPLPLYYQTGFWSLTSGSVIGAGGLGCEILKNLALSGFRDIHVIDMDTIDVSNLNRQFLFREADIGKPKAVVAAEFVEKRVKGVKITPYYGAIQDKDEDYYMQFQQVICGLDSIEARRWINATLINMFDPDNVESLKPLIDGGTEGKCHCPALATSDILTLSPGFKGQSRVILPTLSSCIECQLDMHAPRAAVPLCTLATIPRQPEHCIEWAHIIAWEEERKGDTLDTDDPEHIAWLYQKALKRAMEFNISGVTYSLTQGVVKNIIPAIASTNAIIAASCCNEAFKIATNTNPYLNNYMMYSGNDGVYTYTFEHERKGDCPVCGNLVRDLWVNGNWTLREFIEWMKEQPDTQGLKEPSLSKSGKSLYIQVPGLEQQTRPNLDKKLSELVFEGEEVAVSDRALPVTLRYNFMFKK